MKHLLSAVILVVASCTGPSTGLRGSLLLIGGGLDNDNGPVYRRFLELADRDARQKGMPNVVIMTAATGPEDDEATDKREALSTWRWGVQTVVVKRATPTAAAVAAIDAATGLFFTGGDQQRITDRYRPGGAASPEWQAMQRLLRRGGVIAGASAGTAMMGDVMLLGGSSAQALGIAKATAAAGEAPPQLGPRLGAGMQFLPYALTDSHFFERDRLGRLVAGLEASEERLGLGIGEDAAVEIDLATGEVVGLTVAESLLVDAAHLHRDGSSRRSIVARVIGQGDRVSLPARLATRGTPPHGAAAIPHVFQVPVVEPGQNRQLASWRLFHKACTPNSGNVWRLQLDGWRIVAWSVGGGEAAFDLEVGP